MIISLNTFLEQLGEANAFITGWHDKDQRIMLSWKTGDIHWRPSLAQNEIHVNNHPGIQ